MNSPPRQRGVFLLWIALGLGLGCAQVQPPSGGPVDKTPATLTSSEPANGARSQGKVDAITLRLSEGVDHGSFLDKLQTAPFNLLRQVHWPADTVAVLRYWRPFPADTTVSLWLDPGWLDRHFVEQAEFQILQFSTGDSITPGWLDGQVTFKGAPSRSMHLRLRDAGGGLLREERPDRQGNFVFRHLPADGRDYVLTAFQDVDEDSLYDPSVDFADSLADSLLRLTPALPLRQGLRLNVIDPHEPGEVEGLFACLDSLPGSYVLRLLPDSLRLVRPALPVGEETRADSGLAMADSLPAADPGLLPDSLKGLLVDPRGVEHPLLFLSEPGSFRFTGVAPGPWWLFLFKEMDQDTLWDPAVEPAYLDPGPRWLDPGGKLTWPSIRFPVIVPEPSRAGSEAPADSLAPASAKDSTKTAPRKGGSR